MRVVPSVEVLEADGDALLFGMPGHFLEALDAVGGSLVASDLATLGVLGVLPLVTSEGDDAREPSLGAGVDGLLRSRYDFLVIARIVEALDERRSRHAIGRHGTDQAVLLECGPLFGSDKFDRNDA